jgi:hypothetical protein
MGSLNFECGTQQDAHIDAIYFYPDPIWSMAGVWIALEDIHPDSGPLFYIPGSHREPFAHSDDIVSARPELGAIRCLARNGVDKSSALSALEKAWHADLAARTKAAPAAPVLKAGDAVIWHSLLAHGGMPRLNPTLSRRSVVFHFVGKNARLLTYEQFMLYSQTELQDQQPLVRPLGLYGSLPYHRVGNFVTYGKNGETINPVPETAQQPVLETAQQILPEPAQQVSSLRRWFDRARHQLGTLKMW